MYQALSQIQAVRGSIYDKRLALYELILHRVKLHVLKHKRAYWFLEAMTYKLIANV